MEDNFKRRIEELLTEREVHETELIQSTRHGSTTRDTNINGIIDRLDEIRFLLKELTNLNPRLANEVKKEFSES